MTMPHLMNCSHSCDGWCLNCVKELKEGFAIRLADAEAKADKYKLALERCRTIIEDGTLWDREGVSAVHCVITDALKGGA